MSLELAIEKHTAALVALTAALLAKPAPATTPPPAQSTPGPVAPPANPPATAPSQLSYDVVAKVVSDFVKAHGRAPALLLLEPFKVTTLVPLRDKPAELAGAYAAFTDPVKTAAALAAAAPKA